MILFNNFISSKKKLIYLITSVYILSFIFEHYFKFEYSFLRFSIVEIIFLILILFTFFVYRMNFIKFLFNFEKKNVFETIIFSIFFLKLIKYSMNFQNYYNLYELMIWAYMLGVYFLFKFYLLKDEKLIYYIENSLIAVSLIISMHIIYLYIIYNLGHEANNLWIIRDTTYYPYRGTSPVNFRSIFITYNQTSYLVAPGFIILINRFKNSMILISLVIFYIFILYLIKAKFLIVFFTTLGIFLTIKSLNFRETKFAKFFLLLSIFILSIIYFLATHFLILEKGVINSENLELFKQYYFTEFVISLSNYDIYGSIFLNLKFTAIEVASKFNYILFDSYNYYNNEIVTKNMDEYVDPHSDYFGALANYGILGFLLFLGLPFYIIFQYLRNFDKKIYIEKFHYFLIIIMSFIEALITDFFHNQFIWIIFAIYIVGINIKKYNKLN